MSSMPTSKQCTLIMWIHHSDHGLSIKKLGTEGKREGEDHQVSQNNKGTNIVKHKNIDYIFN